MLISNSAFWIFLVVSIVITFIGIGYFTESKKYLNEKTREKLFSLISVYFFLGHPILLIMYFFSFSNTIVINEDKKFENKLLIIPMQVYGYDLTYGNSCYVINNSSNQLEAKMNLYGSQLYEFDSKKFHTIQEAFSTKEYEINNFDYVMSYIPGHIDIRRGDSSDRYSINFY